MKVELRDKLYWGKYLYKVHINSPGVFYTSKVSDMDEYKAELHKATQLNSAYKIGWLPEYRRNLSDLTSENLETIEALIKFRVSFRESKKGSERVEGDGISFYSSDLTLLQDVHNIPYTAPRFYKTELSPSGVKQFKKEPPASFRVYLKSVRIPSELRFEFAEYVEKTQGAAASSSLLRWLNSPYRPYPMWCQTSYYVNYENSSDYTMMAIKFPELIGKNYKLEKKA